MPVNLLERDECGLTKLDHLLMSVEENGARGIKSDAEKLLIELTVKRLESRLTAYHFLTVLFGSYIAGMFFFHFTR